MIELAELKTLKGIVEKRVVEQLGDPNLNASKLLHALSELTVQDASEPDIGWENAKYHATRLAVELGNAKNDSDKDRRYINRIWKDVVEAYEVIEPSIENDVRKAGLRKILKPRKTDPKTGRVEFYLDIQDVSSSGITDSSECVEEVAGTINYHLAKLPKPNVLGRYFSKLTLEKSGLWLYFLIPGVPLLSMLAWFEFILFGQAYTQILLFLIVTVFLGALWCLIKPFYSLLERGISLAPIWMIQLKTSSAQIEMRRTKKIGPFGRPVKELVFVEYEAECSICGGHVDIIKGKRQHKGRLIGQCSNNGVEHIFSFDQVTKKGVPLRNDIYKGALNSELT